ncbi:MAG: NAD-dependent epimerase/dehydratase family protein [Acidimicrobiales bacterium]
MRVLVTGGAGFIGSHVVDALLAEGVAVRVLDIAGDSPAGAELVRGDIRDPDVVAKAVRGIDAVCHQAAKVGLGVDFGDVADYVDHNDAGTAVLLRALWERSFVGRFVLASSMVVYGEGRARCPAHGEVSPPPRRVEDLSAGQFEPVCACGQALAWSPVDEAAPTDPRNVYAATKLHQEHLCAVWGRESGASVIALRYHNVYGPRMPRDTPYAGVAAIFRSELLAGRTPHVFEDGGQTRDFVHVRDVARANTTALLAPSARPGAYNVASGAPHTVLEMATALSSGFGVSEPPVVTGAWRGGDVRHIVASPEKAATQLGFSAAVRFEDGMREFASCV